MLTNIVKVIRAVLIAAQGVVVAHRVEARAVVVGDVGAGTSYRFFSWPKGEVKAVENDKGRQVLVQPRRELPENSIPFHSRSRFF